MKRLLLSVILAFTFAAPVAAHDEPTDSDALAVFVTEVLEQSQALYAVHQRYNAATDTVEKSAVQAEMRAGVDATIELWERLDKRECFADLASLFADYFDGIANAYSVATTPDERAGFLAQVGVLSGLINNGILVSLKACAPQAEA